MIHRMKRENPGAVIAMTGCFPQAFPEEAQKLSEVDVLVGAGEKKKVLDYVNEYLQKGERIVRITPHTRDEGFEQMSAGSFLERTRAFVKIQDGCEHYCAYCIIPYARGFNRSKPLEELKQELIDLSLKGYREVVLVGIDLSSYGKDLGCHLVDAWCSWPAASPASSGAAGLAGAADAHRPQPFHPGGAAKVLPAFHLLAAERLRRRL